MVLVPDRVRGCRLQSHFILREGSLWVGPGFLGCVFGATMMYQPGPPELGIASRAAWMVG